MKIRILISVWDKDGVYAISYDSSKDPGEDTVIECSGDCPKVDNQLMFVAIDLIKKAIKEE